MTWGLLTQILSTILVSFDKMTERFLVTTQVKPVRLDQKIVGGTYITIKKAPYQVSVQYLGKHICGGSIINEKWALTAAHCVSEVTAIPDDYRVHSGSTFRYITGTKHRVTKILIHDRYEDLSEMFDIALLQVRKPFKTNGIYERKVTLPKAGYTPKEGTVAKATGWGSIMDGWNVPPISLKLVTLRIQNWDTCKKIYAELEVNLTKHMICAGHKKPGEDTCQGDSGGPLIAEKQLVGIVSTGYGCGVRGYPGIYTHVGFFRKWIDKNAVI